MSSKTKTGQSLAVRDLSVVISRGQNRHVILCPEMHLDPGLHLLLGPNGCGKSMLCKALAGIIRRNGGHIDAGRDGALYVWQEQTLFPVSVGANLAMAGTALSIERRQRRVSDALSLFGLSHKRGHRPSQLSGGLCQRASLGRAYVAAESRRVVFFDEPTRETDLHLLDQFVEMVDELLTTDQRRALMIVSHDHQLIYAMRAFSPHIWTMVPVGHGSPGNVESDDTAFYVAGPYPLSCASAEPPTPFLARFLGYQNVFSIGSGDARSMHRLSPYVDREVTGRFCAIAGDELVLTSKPSPEAVEVDRKRLSAGIGAACIGAYERDAGPGVPKVHFVVEAESEHALPPRGWLELKKGLSLRELTLDGERRVAGEKLLEVVCRR